MVWRTLVLFLGLNSAFGDNSPSNYNALKALLPLLNGPAQSNRQEQQPVQNVLQQNNEPQDSINAKLQNILQQIKPSEYKLYQAPVNNNDTPYDRCANSYYSVETLLPILSTFLEILAYTTQLNKAQTVIELLRKYLDLAPPSQEKNNFLLKLKNVEDHLRVNAERNGDDSTFHSTHVHKTTIVFDKELPGVDQQNCRETFGRLIQTAINVYKETAKYPQCQPNTVIDENLFYPSNVVKPQKPYQFMVAYQKPPTSLFTPDYSGISILPNVNVDQHLDHQHPNLFLESQPKPLPYQSTNDLNQNNPFSVVPAKVNPNLDILAPIRQYNFQHPESPTNEKLYLDLLNNLNAKPLHDHNAIQPINPLDNVNPSNMHNSLFHSVVQGPLTSDAGYPQTYDLGSYNLPNNGQLQNYPKSVSDLHVPQQFSNSAVPPGASFMNPLNNLHGDHNTGHANTVLNPIKVNDAKTPELTLEILLSLLGRPDGQNAQINLTPEVQKQLVRYLRPNSPERNLFELQSSNLVPNDDQQYVAYGPDGGTQQGLLNILSHQPDASQKALFSGDTKSDNEAPIKKLQELLGVSNGNKLPPLQNKANVIELTYVLKRPTPLIYRPIYYVKYRLPYQTFVQNFQNLILRKQDMRSEPESLYEELITKSNISDVSPSLRKLEKEDIMKLVFGNGTLIDARVVDVPDKILKEDLEETRKMNAEVDPKVIEELNGSLGLNKSEDKTSPLPSALPWLASPQAPLKRVNDLAVHSLVTHPRVPTQMPEMKPVMGSVGLLAHSNQVVSSNRVVGLSSDAAKPSQPLNVVPSVGNTKASSKS